VRPAPHYSKPSILSAPVKIARGGHFTQSDKLFTPDDLYLIHLKFCDFGTYVNVMDHRNQVTSDVNATVREAAIGRHWFAEARGNDRSLFESFVDLELIGGFDMRPLRRDMHRTFKPRRDTGYYQFDRPTYGTQYVLPDRFIGVI